MNVCEVYTIRSQNLIVWFRYEHKTGFDEGEVLRQLPPPMAKELLQYMYYNVLEGVPMFKVLEEGGI